LSREATLTSSIEKRPGTLVDQELVCAYFAHPQTYEDLVRDMQQRYTFQEARSFLEGRGIVQEHDL